MALTAGMRAEAGETTILPRLRGALAKLAGDAMERGPIVRTRATQAILAFLERRDVAELVAKGCATPDHVLRTKPTALLVQRPAYADANKLGEQLSASIQEFARKYDAYFEEMCRTKKVKKTKLDPWPRIVLLPGFGACSIARDGARGGRGARRLRAHDRRDDDRRRGRDVRAGLARGPLRRGVLEPRAGEAQAVDAGAARAVRGARDRARRAASAWRTVERLLAAGAHVAMVDRDFETLVPAVEKMAKGRKERVLMIVADVTDEDAVKGAFARTVGAWGGVDLVVSNAGNAPEGRLETRGGPGRAASLARRSTACRTRASRAGTRSR